MRLISSDPAEHAKRRSMIAKRYRKSEMDSVSDVIHSHLEQWAQSDRWDEEVDLGVACRALEADIMCESVSSHTSRRRAKLSRLFLRTTYWGDTRLGVRWSIFGH